MDRVAEFSHKARPATTHYMKKVRHPKRYALLVLVGLCCVVVVLAILIATYGEKGSDLGPVHNGKAVSDWIRSIQIANWSDAAVTNLIEII